MNKDKTKKFLISEHWKIIAALMVLFDAVIVNGSYFIALWLRFDCKITAVPNEYLTPLKYITPIYTVVAIGLFFAFKMYHSVWRFASYNELVRTALGSICSSAVHSVVITMLIRSQGVYTRMPISYYFWGAGLQFVLLIAERFSYRFIILESKKFFRDEEGKSGRVMLVGAGSAGQVILRDMSRKLTVSDKVYCIIDDNQNKWHRYIDGVPIVGGREDILFNVNKYNINKIYVALPSAPREELREILNICSEANCEVKNLPGVYQFVNGDISVSAMKEVSVEDLLGREPIKVKSEETFAALSGKVILVTGGGGSIGSELCRQIAQHNPKRLIIFDIYENNAYAIQQELRHDCPELELVTLIGSVRDSRRLEQIFSTYRPEIVYHAAAHKHVPLMEDSPCESIKNNVIGTYKTAYAAMTFGCKRFVLISTDKAVNPTNIMGASKRLCEMIIQSFDRKIKDGKVEDIPELFTHYEDCERVNMNPDKPKTEFVAVRFGNVLGSNGSVIPLFKHQIERGGPVTVTHPDIIRYFMTIPEAVSLVLAAGTYAAGGEIFVLDMGSPVKIDTLARNLIKLSGFKPDKDIKIIYTGLRPGEKLYEEKLMAEEGMKTTPNKLIHIGCPIPFDTDEFLNNIESLMKSAYENDDSVRQIVKGMVSTYKEPAVK